VSARELPIELKTIKDAVQQATVVGSAEIKSRPLTAKQVKQARSERQSFGADKPPLSRGLIQHMHQEERYNQINRQMENEEAKPIH
jgi:hypothetical protein